VEKTISGNHQWKIPSVVALVTCGKTPVTVTWSEHFKICCRVIITLANTIFGAQGFRADL